MRAPSKPAAQAAPKSVTCPHCGSAGDVYEEQPFYLAAQCTSKSCRRCWYACSRCGHLTIDELVAPRVCPECGADRTPRPEPPSTFRGIVLPNAYGMGLQAEIDRAMKAARSSSSEADHAA